MKKRAIVTYFLAFALLFSACVYRIPDNTQGTSGPVLQGTEGTSAPTAQGTESTPSSSDTSPTFETTANPSPTELDVDDFHTYPAVDYIPELSGDIYNIDTLSYQEVSFYVGEQLITGMSVIACHENAEKVIIPDEIMGLPVVSIGDKVFANNTNLTEIALPSSLVAVGEQAFCRCENLTALSLPASVKLIGSQAFSFCPGLTEIRITADMELSLYALEDAVGLKSVYMEDGVVSNNISLSGLTALTTVHLPQGEIRLGNPEYGLSRIRILLGTSVTFIEVPEGIIYLGDFVFEESSLESIVLPSTLTILGEDIFGIPYFGVAPIKEVFYRGTEEQCLQELKDQVADVGATIYYLSETEPTEEGNFWHYVDGQPVIW